MARVVLDDRGKKQRIPPPAASYGMTHLDPRQALLEAARAELAGVSAGLWPRTLGAVVLGMILGLFLYNQALSALGSLDRLGAATVAVLAGSAAAFGFFRLSKPTIDLNRVAVLFRDACMCMVCGYDLVGACPDDDGCIVCPECGAAWHVARLATPAPPQTASEPAASPPADPTRASRQTPTAPGPSVPNPPPPSDPPRRPLPPPEPPASAEARP